MLIKHSIPMQRKNIVKDGLILWLDGEDFINSPPTTLLRDRSMSGHDAIPSGIAYTSLSGSNNKKIILDGVEDKLSIPYSSNMMLGANNFTLQMSLTFNNVSIWQCLLSRRLAPNVDIEYFICLTGNGSIEFRYTTDGTSNMSIAFAFSPVIGTKYNLCFRRLGNSLYLFINGVQHTTVGSLSGALFNSVNDLIICALKVSDGYSSFAFCKLQNLLQYNRALTDVEIIQNYNSIK